jgi:hypothetical protein
MKILDVAVSYQRSAVSQAGCFPIDCRKLMADRSHSGIPVSGRAFLSMAMVG